MKKVAVHNLGCKVNSYEMDIMIQKLTAQGYELVPFQDRADVYVINTCTVTNIADRKSRQMLHRARRQNPDAVVVAVGCYVETDRQQIETDPSIDLAIGNNQKGRIAEFLEEYLDNRAKAGAGAPQDRTLGGQTVQDLRHDSQYASSMLTSPGHTRAYVKIQDGCNQFCSYCIIPYARGRIRSREPDEVVSEVMSLAGSGVREIVLTGIHVSSYRREKGEEPGKALLDLLRRLQLIIGIARIRLGSLEPRIMTEEFVQGIAQLTKVCPHFHLSLQSGCDATLRRMNRHYTTEQYRTAVDLLRESFNRPAITTDVIVGFPGETQEEFEDTVRFLEQIDFYEIHVFKYSVRKGTVAAKMDHQVPESVKDTRSDVLLALTRRQAARYRSQFAGQPEEVLLEEMVRIDGRSYIKGHTARYVEGIVPAESDEDHCLQGSLCAGMLVKGRFSEHTGAAGYLVFKSEME